MAAAITLTIGAAIILGSGHYPTEGVPPVDPPGLAARGAARMIGAQGAPRRKAARIQGRGSIVRVMAAANTTGWPYR